MIIDVILRYPIVLRCLLSFFVVYLNSREYAYVMDTATYRFTAVKFCVSLRCRATSASDTDVASFLFSYFFVLLLHSVWIMFLYITHQHVKFQHNRPMRRCVIDNLSIIIFLLAFRSQIPTHGISDGRGPNYIKIGEDNWAIIVA